MRDVGGRQKPGDTDTGHPCGQKIHHANGEGLLKYLLETSTCVYLLNGNPALKARVKEVGVYSLAVANCVLAELYFGARNSRKVDENIQRIEEFKKNLTLLSDS